MPVTENLYQSECGFLQSE